MPSVVQMRGENFSVVGCRNEHKSDHLLPTADPVQTQWINFIFDREFPRARSKVLYVCSNHFTSDCFTSEGQYKAGLTSELKVNDKSVPIVRDPTSASGAVSFAMFKLLYCRFGHFNLVLATLLTWVASVVSAQVLENMLLRVSH